MKKIIKVLLVVMLVMSMTTPAFATNTFVGSIDVKPSPELGSLGTIPTGFDNAGEEYYGVIKDANGNIVVYLTAENIIVTPYSKVEDATHLTETEKDLFYDEFAELKSGETELEDVEGLDESVKEGIGSWAEEHHMVISQYFDVKLVKYVSGVAEEHEEAYEYLDNGGTLSVSFNFAISTEKHVEVMSFAEEGNVNEWQLARSVNNTGSAIQVVFDHLCPVAILVEADDIDAGEGGAGGESDELDDEQQPNGEGGSAGSQTGDETNPLLWGGICLFAAAAIVILIKASKKEA